MQESGEMYLETIYILLKKSDSVRSIDVANEMGFSKPSVSRGLGILRDGGYVNVDENGYLSLTDAGNEYAEKIYNRHTVLTKLLVSIGVDEKTAAEDACRMEHVISDESVNKIQIALKKEAV